ncbi:MAG: hypothetical protein ACI841_001461, partial [Planctomycetota bacterium]
MKILPVPPNRLWTPTLVCSTALLIASLSGCKSAAEFRAEADVEAYGLIAARRAALFDEEGGFSIDPPEGSVRQRIVSGEWDASIPLTLVDLLEIAAENSHDVRSNREGLYRAALDLTLEQWRNGVQQDAGGSASLTDSGSSESASASVSTGFSKVLDTGASVLAEVGSGLFRIVSTGDGVDLVTDLHLRITQP